MRRLPGLPLLLVLIFLALVGIGSEIPAAAAKSASAGAASKARSILTIILDAGKGGGAEGTEAALSKSLLEQGWQSVSVDGLDLPAGTPRKLLEEALKGRQSSVLELARRTGIPYILVGKTDFAETRITPNGISLTMMTAEVTGKLFKSADGSIVKVFHLTERSSATDPLVARSDVQDKIASVIAESSATQIGTTALHAAAQTQQPRQSFQALLPPKTVAPQEERVAVVIGIENYRSLPKSEFSRKDAQDVATFLEALGFPRRNIEMINDEHATKSDIEKVIEGWLPNRVRPDSTVIVYFSGHGAPEPTTGDAYLMPFDGDPSYLGVTGYPLSRLYDQLAKLPAKKITVLIDSCFSGTGGRSVLAKGIRSITIKPRIASIHDKLFVLTSSQGSQISTSVPEMEHGAFTFYFLQALQAGKRDMTDIFEYLEPRVADEAKKQNVDQTPSFNQLAAKARGKFLLSN